MHCSHVALHKSKINLFPNQNSKQVLSYTLELTWELDLFHWIGIEQLVIMFTVNMLLLKGQSLQTNWGTKLWLGSPLLHGFHPHGILDKVSESLHSRLCVSFSTLHPKVPSIWSLPAVARVPIFYPNYILSHRHCWRTQLHIKYVNEAYLEGQASLSCLVMMDCWWQTSTNVSMIEWAWGTSRLISGSSSYTRWKPYSLQCEIVICNDLLLLGVQAPVLEPYCNY